MDQHEESDDEPRRQAPGAVSVEAALAERYGDRTVTSLTDFLAFADEIEQLIVHEGRQQFMVSRVLQLAAEALLHKLGESVNRLPDEFRADHPHIPWRAIRGMRNVVAHECHVVDYVIVWETVATSLPPAVRDVGRILGRKPGLARAAGIGREVCCR